MKLRELRKAKGWSMKQLGEYLGCSESTISLYELGKREPSFEMLLRISELFEVSIDYLLDHSPNTQFKEVSLYGSEIRKQRKYHHLTIDELSERSGISKNRLLGFEKMTAIPTEDELDAVAAILEIPLPAITNPLQYENEQRARDILDEVDAAFLGGYKDLTEENKRVLRDMVRIMLEHQQKKDE